MLKREGVRQHPASGAGSIKHDGSDGERLVEVKLAGSSHTLRADYLHGLMALAIRQGLTPVLIVEFDSPSYPCTVEATIRPRSPRGDVQ